MSASVLKHEKPTSDQRPQGPHRRRGRWIGLSHIWPWATSTLVHVSLLVLGLAVFFTIRHVAPQDDTPPIIIPSALLHSAGDHESITAAGRLPPRAGSASSVPPAGFADALPRHAAVDPSGLLGGNPELAAHAFLATPQSTVGDLDAAQLAPFGTPRAAGAQGPRTSFFGATGNAIRVVYILDHSGGMLDHLSFLEDEVSRSVRALLPVQRFAVILVSDRADQILPHPDSPRALSRATTANCDAILTQMKKVAPAGLNDNLLTPFDDAFQQAFALHPQLIYFLTDGQFDRRLLARVAQLNPHQEVHINTIAFARRGNQQWTNQLAQLAHDNGGVYRALSDDELEK